MITAEQLKQEVIRLGTEYPNGLYKGPGGQYGFCYYNKGKVYEGTTPLPTEGCIFGQALRNLGVDSPLMGEIFTISELLDKLGVEYDQSKYHFELCQKAQDRSETWGEAIKLLNVAP